MSHCLPLLWFPLSHSSFQDDIRYARRRLRPITSFTAPYHATHVDRVEVPRRGHLYIPPLGELLEMSRRCLPSPSDKMSAHGLDLNQQLGMHHRLVNPEGTPPASQRPMTRMRGTLQRHMDNDQERNLDGCFPETPLPWVRLLLYS